MSWFSLLQNGIKSIYQLFIFIFISQFFILNFVIDSHIFLYEVKSQWIYVEITSRTKKSICCCLKRSTNFAKPLSILYFCLPIIFLLCIQNIWHNTQGRLSILPFCSLADRKQWVLEKYCEEILQNKLGKKLFRYIPSQCYISNITPEKIRNSDGFLIFSRVWKCNIGKSFLTDRMITA